VDPPLQDRGLFNVPQYKFYYVPAYSVTFKRIYQVLCFDEFLQNITSFQENYATVM